MVRVGEKVFRDISGFRFNVSFVDWTSVFEPPELSSGARKTKKVLTREHDGTERETPSLLTPWD